MAVGVPEIAKHGLHHQLASPVRVDRNLRRVLDDRHPLGHAVGGAGRREDHPVHAVIAQRLEQSVRAELHQAGFSFANIALTQDAAEASARNLELVTDLYQRGAADIIQLVDAQNQALGANLAAANALYDFLIDALRVQRASGAFSLEGSAEERDDFIRRLDAFAEQRRRAGTISEPRTTPKPLNKREEN